jgi:glycosyltransferase involved in cell wall biosynthesis
MRIAITVTNDLSYDQRMIRICRSLTAAGHDVVIVGRCLPDSIPLRREPFHQVRLSCRFSKGPLFYAEYNLRLLSWLAGCGADLLWAVDLDTILPVWVASVLFRKQRFFDAHELFCEMRELRDRPLQRGVWRCIERLTVPRFRKGCTVSAPIAKHYRVRFGVEYAVVRNVPPLRPDTVGQVGPGGEFIIYQGAVNEGRCFEQLIPAMADVDLPLHIYGKGNFLDRAVALVRRHGLEGKVLFKGVLPPDELAAVTPGARVGISLFEDGVLQNRWSLANRFFDFIHAGVPQVCSDYEAYRDIVADHPVALLIQSHEPAVIADALNKIIRNEVLHGSMKSACPSAALAFHWQSEEKVLLDMLSSER